MSELVFNRVILERNNQMLSLLSVISLSLNLFLVFAFFHTSSKPPLIVYTEDGRLEVLKTRDLKMDELFLKDFSKMITGQYLSFAGDSLPQQIEGIKFYLGDKPKQSILDSYKINQAAIEKDNMSQQFVIDTISITKETNPFWVEIQGARNIHAAGNDKSMPETYVLEIKKVKSTENNPYGFLMTDIIEKDKLINKGQG